MEFSLRVRVTGKYGYIGKHVVLACEVAGHLVVSENEDAIIHLAGLIDARESLRDPEVYYQTNIRLTLWEASRIRVSLRQRQVRFLFASSSVAANPMNPYASTKRICENLLADWWRAYKVPSVCLRLYNVCGADPGGEIGEDHFPETHLIPKAIRARQENRIFDILGNGSQVRDYVHVSDVAKAFLSVLDHQEGASIYDVGTGVGTTTEDVVRMIGPQYQFLDSDPADVDYLVADPARFPPRWSPEKNVEEAIRDAERYHAAHPCR